jgi:ribonuclease G
MSNELLVSRVGSQIWAVLLEAGRLAEARVEGDRDRPAVGDVVKAKVVNVVPGLDSAFVDIGLDRDAFLPGREIVLPDHPEGLESDTTGHAADRIAPGLELVVQIERDPIASKGARVTGRVNLAGRYVVYHPFGARRTVARRIADEGERERLQTIVEALSETGGFVARTAAKGATGTDIAEEAAALAGLWRVARKRASAARPGECIHQEPDLPVRMLRDLDWAELEAIRVDGEEIRRSMTDYLGNLDRAMVPRIRTHTGPEPLLEAARVDQELHKALRPRVWLKSGGYLIIERTEALVSIDVNTGKFVGKRAIAETVARTNLEAAREIARQIRLRDLGGTIVVDFIDMEDAARRREVTDSLARALRDDRVRSRVVSASDDGLVRIARRRSRRGLDDALMRPCPLCSGSGHVKSAETVAGEVLSEVRRMLPGAGGRILAVRVHPDVARRLTDRGLAADRGVRLVSESSMRPDRFRIVALDPEHAPDR